MKRRDFCDRVVSKVRHATEEEKNAIRLELWGHMEDHVLDLMEGGWTQEAAEERAVESMGDPEVIGAALNSRYSLFWLLLSRVAAVGIALVCVGLLLNAPTHIVYHGWCNLIARTNPTQAGFAQTPREGERFTELDIRTQIGSDILYIYGVGLNEEGSEASIYLCNYDENPLGYASSVLLDHTRIASESGEPWRSGGGGGNVGAYFYRYRGISIGEGDTCLRVTYDSFGAEVAIEVPLKGGDGA